ncbi:MAG TPA: hypothetical protein VFY95_04870 [Sphingomicrobium sp.]
MADRGNDRFIQGNGLIAAAIVVAALIVSWSLPETPRFQIASAGNGVVRLDNDSGELLACDLRQCRRIEAPMRSRTFGPVGIEFRGRDEPGDKKQPQLPAPNSSGN